MKRYVHIVDDERQVREALAVAVEMMDLDCETYQSGSEFLERYKATQPGCVLVDLRMPGMSGLELLSILRKRHAQLPVVIMSGYGDVQSAVYVMRAGAVEFLEKPCRLDVLRECVRSTLQTSEAQREATSWLDVLRARYESLSPGERDVMALTAAGSMDKESARTLDVSIRTVQLRRASVMKKMMAGSRAELIKMAHGISVQPLQVAFDPR
jgi:FixJ family two-component response regulator